MHKKQFPFSFIFLFLIPVSSLFSQELDELTQVKTYLVIMEEDQKEYVGEITKSTADSIWIDVLGKINQLALSDIKDIEHYDYNGYFFQLDRNYTRHVLAPTAFGLKKGQVYYQNLLFTGNLFNAGISDQFSLAGGVSLFSIIEYELIWYVAPKVSFQVNPKFHVGGGVLAASDMDPQDFRIYDFIVVPFLNATYGSRDNNITFGFGSGVEGRSLENTVKAFMLGGNFRFSEKFILVSESTVGVKKTMFDDPKIYYIGAHVLRFLKRKNTVDIGFMMIRQDDEFSPLPYLGYVRFF